ncbi:MAG: hypothetical protein M3134_06660 [Actinomycetota bacterium]|nr:hypothetical protein [Actinomycetota bacterium]
MSGSARGGRAGRADVARHGRHATLVGAGAPVAGSRRGATDHFAWRACEHTFVTSQGSPYARFRRALGTGNPHVVRAAAAELGQVQLEDALAICIVFLKADPAAYPPAATRWHARFVLERRASPPDAHLALAALNAMVEGDRAAAAGTLLALCQSYRLPRAATILKPLMAAPTE